jgi:hypothetical protein
MTQKTKGLLVLALQLVLVLSIAAKYAWERHTCPRVWTRAVQFDPQQPVRGRYLALNLRANACGLPANSSTTGFTPNMPYPSGLNPTHVHSWNVIPLAKNGKLTAVPADPQNPAEASILTLRDGLPCEAAQLSSSTEFFIPEHANSPFPLPPGQELWAEVTVPSSGPPRPIQLALSDGKQFHVLNLR